MESVPTKSAEKLKPYPISKLLSLLGFWSLIDSSLTGCRSPSKQHHQLFVREPVKYYFAIFLAKTKIQNWGYLPPLRKACHFEKFHLQGLKMVFLHRIRVRIDQKKAQHGPKWAKSRLKRAKKSVCGPKHNHFIAELGIPPPLLRKSILPKNKLQIRWVPPPPPFTEKMCEVEVIDRLRNSCNKNRFHCLEIGVTNLL